MVKYIISNIAARQDYVKTNMQKKQNKTKAKQTTTTKKQAEIGLSD